MLASVQYYSQSYICLPTYTNEKEIGFQTGEPDMLYSVCIITQTLIQAEKGKWEHSPGPGKRGETRPDQLFSTAV